MQLAPSTSSASSTPSATIVATSAIKQPISSGHGFDYVTYAGELHVGTAVKTVQGSLQDAVAAAQAVSTPTKLKHYEGSTAVGVFQAGAGAFEITPLLNAAGAPSFVLGNMNLHTTGATQSFQGVDAGLRAIVGTEGDVAFFTAAS